MRKTVGRTMGLGVLMLTAGVAFGQSPPFHQCPPVGQDTSCSILIVVRSDGAICVSDPTQSPYDGIEDTLVGLQNNSSSPICQLALNSPNLPIFGFDGDGLCHVSPRPSGCPFGGSCPGGSRGYEGPGVCFTVTTLQRGTVHFSPCIAPGGSAYFSLEERIPPNDCPIDCIGATDGTSCDDGNPGTLCDACHSGTCTGASAPNGTPCNDGNICTQADVCQSGTCVGSAASGTSCDDGNPGTLCDACQSGVCVGSTAPNGTSCSDGNACTQADMCQSGSCVGSAVPNGASCNDGNACTQADTCQSGTCVGSAAPNGTPCNDGNACTQTDTCQSSACVGSNFTCCTGAPNGTLCTDGNTCTQSDTCQSGTCAGSVVPNGTSCDDVNPCTQTDICQSGTCVGTAVPNGTSCSATSCSQICQSGTCVHAMNKHSIVWDPVPGSSYDIIYGDLQLLHSSGVTASVGGCLGQDLLTPASDDPDSPSSGEGFWYAVRGRSGCGSNVGTYDEGGNQIASRDPLIPAALDCSRPLQVAYALAPSDGANVLEPTDGRRSNSAPPPVKRQVGGPVPVMDGTPSSERTAARSTNMQSISSNRLSRGANDSSMVSAIGLSGLANAAQTNVRTSQGEDSSADAAVVDSVGTILHLGVIEQSGSLGPPPGGRPFPPLTPVFPHSFSAEGGQTLNNTLPVLPSTPESNLPGVCVGGANNGQRCLVAGDCAAPGVCNFYRVTIYQNENTTGFTSTATPRNPVLDDVNLAGGLMTPPAMISSVEFPFVPESGGIPSGATMRVEVRFWDTLSTAVSPVNSGFLGGGSFLVNGPVASGFFYTLIGILSPPYPAPTDPSIAVQLDYRDNTTNALQYATVLFSNPAGTGAPQVGSSANLYYRDANSNGQFDSSDSRSFTAPNLANFYLHLGAEYPTMETEPNNTQGTASVTASCLTLGASISPIADVDWYKFTINGTQALVMDVACGSPSDDSTLTLRDSSGIQIDFNDDASGTNRCSRITRNLAAGTYFLEVHEKGDNATIASYTMEVGAPGQIVTNLKVGCP